MICRAKIAATGPDPDQKKPLSALICDGIGTVESGFNWKYSGIRPSQVLGLAIACGFRLDLL